MVLLIKIILCIVISLFLVPEIIHAWQGLVKQFKQSLADENKVGSGSASKENDFPYFENLMFLKPTLQHRQPFSSLNISSKPAQLPEVQRLHFGSNKLVTPSKYSRIKCFY